MKGLRYVLLALTVYMTVVGGLFLFAPRVAEVALCALLSELLDAATVVALRHNGCAGCHPAA